MENQNTEWKEIWHDEYLKTVCGFANALGGTIEIGKNNKGIITGVENAERLLDELPKKIRTTMGIVVDVNLRRKNSLNCVVVKVKAYPNAISYRGKYYLRSGSTNHEVTGFALDEMILRKYGRTWDSAPVPHVKPKEFYHDAFDIFRKKAVSSERLANEDVTVSNEKLLQALKLVDGHYLLKAALLLFHQDPEQWCLGSYAKIGYFKNDADIVYQDEINGPLISIADRIMDTIYTKYFRGIIHYEGIQRIDKYPMPREVLREAVLNAVIHKDYSTGNPIHIKIYDDKVIVYNDQQLPPNTTPKSILKGIGSKPHNPLIANAFFRSGQIEAWGRGIEKMKSGCIADNLPEPEFDILPNTFSICFHIRKNNQAEVDDGGTNFGTNFGVNFGVNTTEQKIIDLMLEDPQIRTQDIAEKLNLTTRNIEYAIRSLRKAGIVERIGATKNGHWVVKPGAPDEV